MRLNRETIRQAVEAPKQAVVLSVIAIGVAALALLIALGAIANKGAAA